MKAFALVERLQHYGDEREVMVSAPDGRIYPCSVVTRIVNGVTVIELRPDGESSSNTDDIHLDDFQRLAMQTAVYADHGQQTTRALSKVLAGVSAEAGVALREWIEDSWSDEQQGASGRGRRGIAGALAKVLWYCAAAARELDFPLSEVARRSLADARIWHQEHHAKQRQGKLLQEDPPARSGKMAAAGRDD